LLNSPNWTSRESFSSVSIVIFLLRTSRRLLESRSSWNRNVDQSENILDSDLLKYTDQDVHQGLRHWWLLLLKLWPTQTSFISQWRWRCASQQNRVANVRFGSKADIAARPRNVRFTPKSGHGSSSGNRSPIRSQTRTGPQIRTLHPRWGRHVV